MSSRFITSSTQSLSTSGLSCSIQTATRRLVLGNKNSASCIPPSAAPSSAATSLASAAYSSITCARQGSRQPSASASTTMDAASGSSKRKPQAASGKQAIGKQQDEHSPICLRSTLESSCRLEVTIVWTTSRVRRAGVLVTSAKCASRRRCSRPSTVR